jgi:hypothetical protein
MKSVVELEIDAPQEELAALFADSLRAARTLIFDCGWR